MKDLQTFNEYHSLGPWKGRELRLKGQARQVLRIHELTLSLSSPEIKTSTRILLDTSGTSASQSVEQKKSLVRLTD